MIPKEKRKTVRALISNVYWPEAGGGLYPTSRVRKMLRAISREDPQVSRLVRRCIRADDRVVGCVDLEERARRKAEAIVAAARKKYGSLERARDRAYERLDAALLRYTGDENLKWWD